MRPFVRATRARVLVVEPAPAPLVPLELHDCLAARSGRAPIENGSEPTRGRGRAALARRNHAQRDVNGEQNEDDQENGVIHTVTAN